jgi:hypothetical protein
MVVVWEVLLTLVMNIWPPVEEVLVICIRGTKRSQTEWLTLEHSRRYVTATLGGSGGMVVFCYLFINMVCVI